jgi:hypothetical protein
MENLEAIYKSMQSFYDRKIKNYKHKYPESGNFHEQTLETCTTLIKALSLKNKKLLKEGSNSHQLEAIKKNLLEGEEIFD